MQKKNELKEKVKCNGCGQEFDSVQITTMVADMPITGNEQVVGVLYLCKPCLERELQFREELRTIKKVDPVEEDIQDIQKIQEIQEIPTTYATELEALEETEETKE